MTGVPSAITLPVWVGGLEGSAPNGPSQFGGYELLLTAIATIIIFAILGPRWNRDRQAAPPRSEEREQEDS